VIPTPAEVTAELAEAARSCDARAAIEVAETLDAGGVLTAWMDSITNELGLADETPWISALCVLNALSSTDRELTEAELTQALRAERRSDVEPAPCLDCALVHEMSPVDGRFGSPGQHCSKSVTGRLADYGVVGWAEAGPDGMVWLTPLGRMLAESIFTGCAPGPEADAETLMTATRLMPPGIMTRMTRSWLAARSPADAVRELLAYAEPRACTGEAWVALVLASSVGPAGIEGWRDWADRPGFGVYARDWLRDHGEPVTRPLSDEAWRGIDTMLLALRAEPEQVLARAAAMMAADLKGMDEVIVATFRDCGHPSAHKFADLLEEVRRQVR
jgi:hypothetical protein